MTKKTLPPDPEQMNDDRAEWAGAALRHFQCATRTDYDDAIGDLLADLMHWSDRNNFDLALDRARGNYAAEIMPTAEVATSAGPSPSPFTVEYSPFIGKRGSEIPSYRIFDADGGKVAETDSDKPEAVQRADATLPAAAPVLLTALDQAVQALNDAPRFRLRHLDTDSYRIAAVCDRAIATAKGGAA